MHQRTTNPKPQTPNLTFDWTGKWSVEEANAYLASIGIGVTTTNNKPQTPNSTFPTRNQEPATTNLSTASTGSNFDTYKPP